MKNPIFRNGKDALIYSDEGNLTVCTDHGMVGIREVAAPVKNTGRCAGERRGTDVISKDRSTPLRQSMGAGRGGERRGRAGEATNGRHGKLGINA
jgi:hypothetical protein